MFCPNDKSSLIMINFSNAVAVCYFYEMQVYISRKLERVRMKFNYQFLKKKTARGLFYMEKKMQDWDESFLLFSKSCKSQTKKND